MILNYKKDGRKYRVIVSTSVLPQDPALVQEHMQLQAELRSLRASTKGLSKEEQKTVGKIISQIKGEVADSKFTVQHTLIIQIGKNSLEYTLSEPANTAMIKDGVEELIGLVREKRAGRTNMESEERNFLGIHYETIGGAFNKPGTITALLGSIDHQERIQTEKRPHPKVKDNYIGIEVEMNMAVTRADLDKLFIDSKLSGYVKNKTDGSISSRDGEHAIEVTALFKQNRTNEIVNAICNVIKKAKGAANNSCGLHVHLDMRNRDAAKCYSNLYYCLPIINAIVPPNRVTGDWSTRYCAQNQESLLDNHLSRGGRYWAINAASIRQHKTLEVRIHSGTVNATKIINFVKLLAMIVDHDALSSRISTIEEFRTAFPEMSNELYEYLIKRQDTMKNKVKDTVTDITTDNDYLEVSA